MNELKNYKFIVQSKLGTGAIISLICFFSIIVILAFIEYLNYGILTTSIFTFMITLFVIIRLLANSYFKIIVDGTKIKVRKIGKECEFDAIKIKKVKCSASKSSRYGNRFWVEIDAEDKNLVIDMGKDGAQKMIEYLLYLHELRILDSQVITDKCKKELEFYREYVNKQ